MASNAVRSLCRSAATRVGFSTKNSFRQVHDVVPKDKPLMDLLPIPEGSWKQHYDKQNAKYNIHLLGGVLFFFGSLGIAYNQGFLFMNAYPPPLPKN